jgi:hypothetical protein
MTNPSRFWTLVRDSVAEVNDTDVQALPGQMQRHGYYASIQGPWLVCSKSVLQRPSRGGAA